MSVDDGPPPSAPQGSTEVSGSFWGLDVYCFQVCHYHPLPSRDSDGQDFGESTGDLGEHKEVPMRKRQTEH